MATDDALPIPLTERECEVSLVVASFVRARARMTLAQRAFRQAVDEAFLLGFTEADLEIAMRASEQFADPEKVERESQRAFTILQSCGANVDLTPDTPRKVIEEVGQDEYRALFWREGWFAAVLNAPVDTSIWPAGDWRAEQKIAGFVAFTKFERANGQRKRTVANAA